MCILFSNLILQNILLYASQKHMLFFTNNPTKHNLAYLYIKIQLYHICLNRSYLLFFVRLISVCIYFVACCMKIILLSLFSCNVEIRIILQSHTNRC